MHVQHDYTSSSWDFVCYTVNFSYSFKWLQDSHPYCLTRRNFSTPPCVHLLTVTHVPVHVLLFSMDTCTIISMSSLDSLLLRDERQLFIYHVLLLVIIGGSRSSHSGLYRCWHWIHPIFYLCFEVSSTHGFLLPVSTDGFVQDCQHWPLFLLELMEFILTL